MFGIRAPIVFGIVKLFESQPWIRGLSPGFPFQLYIIFIYSLADYTTQAASIFQLAVKRAKLELFIQNQTLKTF